MHIHQFRKHFFFQFGHSVRYKRKKKYVQITGIHSAETSSQSAISILDYSGRKAYDKLTAKNTATTTVLNELKNL